VLEFADFSNFSPSYTLRSASHVQQIARLRVATRPERIAETILSGRKTACE
jgi:hypothetical protein